MYLRFRVVRIDIRYIALVLSHAEEIQYIQNSIITVWWLVPVQEIPGWPVTIQILPYITVVVLVQQFPGWAITMVTNDTNFKKYLEVNLCSGLGGLCWIVRARELVLLYKWVGWIRRGGVGEVDVCE